MNSTPLAYHILDSPDYEELVDRVIEGLGPNLGETAKRKRENYGRKETLEALANLSSLYDELYESSPILASDNMPISEPSGAADPSARKEIDSITKATEKTMGSTLGE